MATILIDDRERDKNTGTGKYNKGRESIINHFAPFVEKHCMNGRMLTAEVQHMVVSDYAIMLHNETHSKLVMAIERKTLADLAGSIKGRLNSQIESMKELREKKNCQLLIILEGSSAFPKKTTTYGNIPYANLHAKLRHILIRDNIPWVLSKNQSHTAEIICDLAVDYIALSERGDIEIDFDKGKLGGVPEELTKKKESPDDLIVLKMWCAVPGLHEHVSMVLRKEYSLAELMVGEIETEAIAELKYASGVSVGTKRAEKIKKSAMMPSTHIKILAEIPGVSKAAAERILNSVDEGMISLYFMELDEIRNLHKTDKTKVGPKLAGKIKKFMELA